MFRRPIRCLVHNIISLSRLTDRFDVVIPATCFARGSWGSVRRANQRRRQYGTGLVLHLTNLDSEGRDFVDSNLNGSH